MTGPEPEVRYTVREMFDKIDARLDGLEQSAARQTTVRWAVGLSVVSVTASPLLTWLLTRH